MSLPKSIFSLCFLLTTLVSSGSHAFTKLPIDYFYEPTTGSFQFPAFFFNKPDVETFDLEELAEEHNVSVPETVDIHDVQGLIREVINLEVTKWELGDIAIINYPDGTQATCTFSGSSFQCHVSISIDDLDDEDSSESSDTGDGGDFGANTPGFDSAPPPPFDFDGGLDSCGFGGSFGSICI